MPQVDALACLTPVKIEVTASILPVGTERVRVSRVAASRSLSPETRCFQPWAMAEYRCRRTRQAIAQFFEKNTSCEHV